MYLFFHFDLLLLCYRETRFVFLKKSWKMKFDAELKSWKKNEIANVPVILGTLEGRIFKLKSIYFVMSLSGNPEKIRLSGKHFFQN